MQTYLTVLFSILILNILPLSDNKRRNIILPISFIILWIFLAFRYNYGIDYINYNKLFYAIDEHDIRLESEPLFWWIMKQFDYYYQFIIFQTTAICLTFYYFTKKYISPNYYWLFFVLFICHTGMMFTLTTAMRSGFAGLVFMWCTEFFYLRKNKPILYFLSIYLAFLFHNSAILLILFPLSDILIRKMSIKVWIIFIILGFIISITSISNIIETALSEFSDSSNFSSYSKYIGNKFVNSTFKITLVRLFLVLPGIFIYKEIIYNNKIIPVYKKIASLSLIYMVLHIFGFDFQNRLTVIIYIFYIISASQLLPALERKPIIRYGVLGLILFTAIWSAYIMFDQQLYLNPEGTFWEYQTIFDAPRLP